MTRANEHLLPTDDRRSRADEALRKWGDGTSGDPLGVAWRAIATAQVRHEFWAMVSDGLDSSLTEDQFREGLRRRVRLDFHEHLVDAFMGAVEEVFEGKLL